MLEVNCVAGNCHAIRALAPRSSEFEAPQSRVHLPLSLLPAPSLPHPLPPIPVPPPPSPLPPLLLVLGLARVYRFVPVGESPARGKGLGTDSVDDGSAFQRREGKGREGKGREGKGYLIRNTHLLSTNNLIHVVRRNDFVILGSVPLMDH